LRNTILIDVALLGISLIVSLPVQAISENVCPAQLQTELGKVAQSPELKAARIGIFVQTNAPKPIILANLDGDRYFLPASNTKLFTTATALKVLGANYQFGTHLMSHNLPNNKGELEDGLWLMGSGDPSFNSDDGLKSLVTQLKAKGVKRIKGGLWTGTSRKGTEVVDSWEWSDLQHYYAAIASPFTINENALNWEVSPSAFGKPPILTWEKPLLAKDWDIQNQATTVSADSAYTLEVIRPYGKKSLIITGQIPEKEQPELGGVAIPNPEENVLALLRQELIAQGIEIPPNSSNTYNANAKKLPPTQDLAIALSPPLSQLITTTNKDSNNLYAELLLRALGDRLDAINPDDSLDRGLMVIKKYLQSINITTEQVALVDGSGLSRQNLTTPRAIVQLLQTVSNDENFRKSLPISNVDGTLKDRFKNQSNKVFLQAKTGSFSGTMALSGYAKPSNYQEVIFSLIINNSNLSSRQLQKYIDELALVITRLKSC
jgi:D-alanyl-D-alanine carboxypeptidase/D-alanyl-D-alanine-endopeptidase (penicillin-binding protein 4)